VAPHERRALTSELGRWCRAAPNVAVGGFWNRRKRKQGWTRAASQWPRERKKWRGRLGGAAWRRGKEGWPRGVRRAWGGGAGG
jgi:hypothetical protein